MSVGRICSRSVDLAQGGETIEAAARRMRERKVGTLVVVDHPDSRLPIGILTDRDLVLRAVAEGRSPGETRVEEVMTRDPRLVEESTSIDRALTLMRTGTLRRLPVVDADGFLVGVISLDDVLSSLAGQFSQIGALLEKEMPVGSSLD